MEPRPIAIADEDVYALTPRGAAQLNHAGTALSFTDLEILVLVDGKASVGRLVRGAPGIDPGLLRATLGKLLRAGYIGASKEVHSDVIEAEGLFEVAVPPGAFAAATPEAHAEADSTLSSLRRDGYSARIARRATTEHRPADGTRLRVLVVDDDPELAKLLRSYLGLEDFAVQTAGNRDEIVAALRRPPPPDVVLLDVTLPDADGFDVLARMRAHPALRAVPVIMMTGRATREAVLRGLLGGANGYVTKPFEVDALMQALRAVLGVGAVPPGAEGEPVLRPQVFGAEGGESNADYRARLQTRLRRIEALQHELAAGTVPSARLAELHRELHTIAGSGEMFGVPAVSQAARAGETFLEQYRAAGTLPGPDGWADLRKLIAALVRAAQAS